MANATIRKARPKYLSLTALLFEIRLPLPGWVSILHRVSGLLLFLAVVWLLFMLDRSLASEAGFASIRRYLGLPLVKLSLLALIWASSKFIILFDLLLGIMPTNQGFCQAAKSLCCQVVIKTV